MMITQRVSPSIRVACAFGLLACSPASADEGGVSFWIPGFFGSLAATPQQPGWSLATIGYHTSVKAGGDVGFARQVSRGQLTANLSATIDVALDADATLAIAVPTYVFQTPVLGGQAAVALLVPYGRNEASVDATLTGALGPIPFTISGGRRDGVSGFGDLVPMFSLRWNQGVHNWMTYVSGNVPIGRYDSRRLANLGIGHQSIDAGGGYTYLDQKTGQEFSAAGGFTYNFENPYTDYQNGVDFHLDAAASRFLSKQLMIGVVGYAFQQLSADTGARNRVGAFMSRVFGAGPQIGYIFPLGERQQGYLNLKAYKEFGAEHRPEGWNIWLTFAISPAPQTTQQTAKH